MRQARSGPELEIRRQALLERLERACPKIVAMVAPAGFGKTTLVRQYLESAGAWAICDCSGVRDDVDLARRLIPALAIENPEREHGLTQTELKLGDGGTTIVERLNITLDAWRQPSDGTIVFENCEHLARSGSARDFFARLLATRPEGRAIVMCSREDLRMHLTRFAAPHEIVVLHAHDLAFNDDQVREMFATMVEDAASVERIVTVSQGWPIAVLLLLRFAAEGRIAMLLDRLDDLAFDELHDYLADEVLASLEPQLVQAIVACACIPRATDLDLRGISNDANFVRHLWEFAKESPFVARGSKGIYTVHPLLATLLLEHHEERRDALLQSVASYHESNGRFPRAAELHLARGDKEAAARALGQHEVVRDPAPSMSYALVLSQLDQSLIQQYPRLWGVTALLRMFCVDAEPLLDEATAIWRLLSPDVSLVERYYIILFRVVFMVHLGLMEEACELVEAFAEQARNGEAPRAFLDGFIPYLRALPSARMGRLNEAERDLTRALPFVSHLDVMAAGTFATLGADIARVRGERAVERRFLEQAIERARSSGLSNILAFDLAEALVGAWLAGEDALADRYAEELQSKVARFGIRGFAYLAAAACGREGEPSDADSPKFVMYARLIAAARSADVREARRLAASALVLAERAHSPFLQALAAIAVALSDELKRAEYLEVAREAAARCESAQFVESIAVLAAGGSPTGMLAAYIRRFERERSRAVAPIEIEVIRGGVRVNGAAVALSNRELELLVALSIRRETLHRARLASILWPEQDEYAARNALSVALHRLRGHMGRDDIVVRDGEGYRLHADARVDLWEIERRAGILLNRRTHTKDDRNALERLAEQLGTKRPERMLRWDWFEPTERRLRELHVQATHRLASDALARNDASGALRFCEETLAHDPCDEPACEIAIRAHLELGDRAAAVRQYRRYRRALLDELGCEPSASLTALVS